MKPIALALAALALLAGLFLWLRPAPEAAPVPAAQRAAPAIVIPKIFELRVAGKNLVAGEPTLRVNQGERVILRITSDRADELHLHGYDLSLVLKPNVAGELKFTANLSGRFDFELHHAHLELGALEVTPK